MRLHALTKKGEAVIDLQSNDADDRYCKQVRELLSAHYLGSPGGYPVFLRRWTRMGQNNLQNLDALLLLGEPEAVTAVVHSAGISLELARRSWWIDQNVAHARCLLRQKAVRDSSLGQEVAQFVLDYLPFEQEAAPIIESVRLILQDNLLAAEQVNGLWRAAARKTVYLVGFLQSRGGQLPLDLPAHPALGLLQQGLDRGQLNAGMETDYLLKVLSSQGQAFIATLLRALSKPVNQDMVVALLNVIRDYFSELNPQRQYFETPHLLQTHYLQQVDRDAVAALRTYNPQLAQLMENCLFLSLIDEHRVTPVFTVSDAIGSLMRRKILPLMEPVQQQLESLCNTDH